MPLVKNVTYIKEPTDLQCGQAVLAMLTGKTVKEIIDEVGTEQETTLKDMFRCLEANGIEIKHERIAVVSKHDLPDICVLSLETPRCWHWSLYFKGLFYDPEHGVMDDFPKSNRRYFWKIVENPTQN